MSQPHPDLYGNHEPAATKRGAKAKSLPKRQHPAQAPSPPVQTPPEYTFKPLPDMAKVMRTRMRQRKALRFTNDCPACLRPQVTAFDSGLWAVVCVTKDCPRCPASGDGYREAMAEMKREREVVR